MSNIVDAIRFHEAALNALFVEAAKTGLLVEVQGTYDFTSPYAVPSFMQDWVRGPLDVSNLPPVLLKVSVKKEL